jgi:hypothetical protein
MKRWPYSSPTAQATAINYAHNLRDVLRSLVVFLDSLYTDRGLEASQDSLKLPPKCRSLPDYDIQKYIYYYATLSDHSTTPGFLES